MDEGTQESSELAGAVAAPDETPSEAILDAVKEALGVFNKAVRFRRMYPTTHEFYLRVLIELRDRLVAALALSSELRLEVAAQSFHMGKAVVFTDERGQANLPFRFYKDGIKTITFRVGVDEHQLGRLLDALQLDSEQKGGQDDLAINLWNAGLEHIAFFAVDELDPESAREKREGEDDDPARSEMRALGARVEEMLERIGEATLPASAGEISRASGFLRQLSFGEKEVFEVERGEGFSSIEEHSEGEVTDELFAEEASLELTEMRDVSDLPRRTIGMLRWLIEHGEVAEDARDHLPGLVWDLLGQYIFEGRLDILNRAIAELRIGQLRAQGEARVFCQKIVDGIAEPTRIDAVLRLINARKANEKDLQELLSVMPDAGLEELAPLFTKIRSDDGRRLVLGALVDRAGAAPDILKPIVRGDDAQAALEAMRALKAVESPWAIDILIAGIRSTHADVRAEAIRAIPHTDLERYDEDLAAALLDASASVRGLAARRLALAGTAVAVKALRERLGTPTATHEERVGLLRALAIADPNAIETLIAEAGPRRRRFGFFAWHDVDPLRRDLVVALGNVPTPAAREFLQRCVKSDDRPLRKLAEDALRRGPERSDRFDDTKRRMLGETGRM
jgi:HEAT repeat protein